MSALMLILDMSFPDEMIFSLLVTSWSTSSRATCRGRTLTWASILLAFAVSEISRPNTPRGSSLKVFLFFSKYTWTTAKVSYSIRFQTLIGSDTWLIRRRKKPLSISQIKSLTGLKNYRILAAISLQTVIWVSSQDKILPEVNKVDRGILSSAVDPSSNSEVTKMFNRSSTWRTRSVSNAAKL